MSDRFIIPRPIACSIAFVALFLYGLFAFVLVPARSDAYIYWVDYDGSIIGRANTDGTNPNANFITANVGSPVGLAVDSSNIYWSNLDDRSIAYAPVGGSPTTKIFNTGGPWNLAINSTHVFWANTIGTTIGQSSRNLSNQNQGLIQSTGTSPWGVAVDGNYVYWSYGPENDGRIGRANLDGSNPNSNFITGINGVRSIAVNGSHIYWSSFGSKSIGRANIDGTSPNYSLIQGTASPNGIALDGSHVYWSNVGPASIGRANLDGTGASQTFAAISSASGAIAVDSRVPPPSLTIDSGPAGLTNNAGPTFGFTAQAGSSVTCSIDTGTPSYGPCTTSSTHSPPEMIADGSYTFRVRAAFAEDDPATMTRNFTVDTVAPDTEIELGPPEVSDSPDTTFFFRSPDVTATFQCRLDSQAFTGCESGIDVKGMSDGSHTFEVRAHDAAGNSDSTPASRTFVVDTTPDVDPPPVKDTTPPIVKITGKPKAKVKTKSGSVKVKVSFTSEAGAVFKCRLDKAAFKACSSPYSVKAKSGKGKGKKHTIQVTATDKAGNQSKAASVSFKVIRKR